jgi:hypothetical protein
MIYEVKLKEAMNEFFVELMKDATIDNKLTGHVKLAHEESEQTGVADKNVKLMSNPDGEVPSNASKAGSGLGPAVKLPTPAALSPDVIKK